MAMTRKGMAMMTPDDALGEFRRQFDCEPDGVWAAPGRVNLIGEHTDYNAGLVLPIALPQRTFAAVRRRDDDQVRLVSAGMPPSVPLGLDEIAPGRPADWGRYPAGVLWALREAGYAVTGVDAAFTSEVPVGSGLSSSAAIEGAIAAAASDLNGLDLLADDAGRSTLARICQRAENHIAGAPTGGMDQAASLRSRPGHALYLDCADGSVTHVPFRLAECGLALLVIDTRAEHSNSSGEYGKRRADCERACDRLGIGTLREIDPADLVTELARLDDGRLIRRVRHIVTETERVRLAVQAMEADDFAELGRLFVDSHVSLRDDFEVSCAELDVAVLAALEAGALGARMTGGGFGGSAIALVYENRVGAIKVMIEQSFADHGFTQPHFILAQAGGSARCVLGEWIRLA